MRLPICIYPEERKASRKSVPADAKRNKDAVRAKEDQILRGTMPVRITVHSLVTVRHDLVVCIWQSENSHTQQPHFSSPISLTSTQHKHHPSYR